jgi:hypothetical protein
LADELSEFALANDLRVSCEYEMRLQLRAGTGGDAEEPREVFVSFSPAAFGNICGNRSGCAENLILERRVLAGSDSFAQTINTESERVRFVPN